MLSWLQRKRKTAVTKVTAKVKEIEENAHQGTRPDPEEDLKVSNQRMADDLAATHKFNLSQAWMARVQESLNLHLILQFPALRLGNSWDREPIVSRLVPIKPLGKERQYPKGNWERQKLMIHFKDLRLPVEGYRPVVSQLAVGVAIHASPPDDGMSPHTHIGAFVYNNDRLCTPRLPRDHQHRLVKDLMALGINLNQQLESLGWRVTHIDLERRTHQIHAALTSGHPLRIDALDEIKYGVTIPHSSE